MRAVEKTPSSSPSLDARTFDTGDRENDREDLYGFIGAAGVRGVIINVVGPKTDPKILVINASTRARRKKDWVIWVAGANCAHWRVTFDKGVSSPLDPDGPYESDGVVGGFAVGDPGKYPYTVVAEDSRTGNTVTLDPDVVIVM